MRRLIFFLFVLTFSIGSLAAQVLDIGLFRQSSQQSVMIYTGYSEYEIWGDSSCIDYLVPGAHYKLWKENDSLRLAGVHEDKGRFRTLSFIPVQDTACDLRLKPMTPQGRERFLCGSLLVRADRPGLRLVNRVDMEDYLSGVVLSEAGMGHTDEYYQAQAIISRTYALAHLRKHDTEGFDLCDQVHCQAYFNRTSPGAQIRQAAYSSRGIVLVDDSLKFITAVFHSNCGGQTANSEQVWSRPLPYLRSVQDAFCRNQPNAFWKKELSTSEWIGYLRRQGFPVDDSLCRANCVSYRPQGRPVFFSAGTKKLHFKIIRSDLQLKSAWFSVEQTAANTVILRGRGFGHGVGLCQEGAMKMGTLGFDHKTILHHYFTGVHLMHVSELEILLEQ